MVPHGCPNSVLGRRNSGRQVIQKAASMGGNATAPEVGLELYHRVSPLTRKPLHRTHRIPDSRWKVRRKNSTGSLCYIASAAKMHLPEVGVPAGNEPTSLCGVTTSRQGLRLPVAELSMAVTAVFRFSWRICSSKIKRLSSCFIFPISSAWGAETALSSRIMESSARSASSLEGDFTAEADSSEYPPFRSDRDRRGQGFG